MVIWWLLGPDGFAIIVKMFGSRHLVEEVTGVFIDKSVRYKEERGTEWYHENGATNTEAGKIMADAGLGVRE